MSQLIDLFVHLDVHLSQLIAWAGGWSYAFLFLVIFCETGLVVTPFLPGDSFLFASGSLATLDGMNIWILTLVLFIAAFLGNEVNYRVGRHLGLKLLEGPFRRWVNKEHLQRTETFFAKYGAKAVVLGRFVPIVRTIVPFVAGVGKMDPKQFSVFNALGAAAWVILFTWSGYLFGNIPSVRRNFSLVILAIVIISFIPPCFEWWKGRKGHDKRKET